MKNVCFTLLVILIGMTSTAQNTNTLLDQFIIIKNELVKGDGKMAETSIHKFYELVKGQDAFALKPDLLKAVEKLHHAGPSIENQRAAFNEVSTTMWKMVKDSDQINKHVFYQYCPMKKTYWLSLEKEIRNPYYGSSMLTCGKVVDTK